MRRDPEATRAYQRDYYANYARAARGARPMMDAEPVRAHIERCLDLGMTMRQVSIAAGVNEGTTSRILSVNTRVRHNVGRRILGVRPRRPVTAIGLTRRVRALAALGWTAAQIAQTAGVNTDTVKSYRAGQGTVVKVGALPLLDAYNKLSMRAPATTDRYSKMAATRARNDARKAGWAPPLAWDDETIDDPSATPNLGGNECGIDHDDLVMLINHGATWETLQRRLGITRSGIAKSLERASRTDLLTILSDRNELGRQSRQTARWAS